MSDFSGDIIVPDSWEPVIGYRTFNVRPSDPWLHSTGISFESYWTPDVNTARCMAHMMLLLSPEEMPDPEHVAPDPECRCGFYALKSPELLMDHFGVESWTGSMDSIWAKVCFWGTVIEGSTGYRAQYAKVVEVLALPNNMALAMRVAQVYSVDVSLELLTSYAWFVGGPAHGRVLPASKVRGAWTYVFPVLEVHGMRHPKDTRPITMGQALYQRDGRAQMWRFRGYQR